MKFSNPICVNSKLVLLHEKLERIRKIAIELEDGITPSFLAPEIFPIPDEAPVEIPRAVFKSKHGHTALQIAPIKTELTTHYDENFNDNFETCFDYIKKRSAVLTTFSKQTNLTASGLGLVMMFRWPSLDETESVLAEKLEKKLLPSVFDVDNIYDIRLHLAKVVEDKYFLNTQYNNYRAYSSSSPINSPHPRLKDLRLDQFGLEVTIDINDRYGYNTGSDSRGAEEIDLYISKIKEELLIVERTIIGDISNGQ